MIVSLVEGKTHKSRFCSYICQNDEIQFALVNQIIMPLWFFRRHGYIDPRGDVREFTYKSGIPCDPETKQPLQPDSTDSKPVRNKKGYFDYSDNRFVLPSGRRVKVVVNKANRARG